RRASRRPRCSSCARRLSRGPGSGRTRSSVTEPRWLNETERQAWMSLLTVVLVGMPQLDRTFRPHGLVHVEYGLLAALSDQPSGVRLRDLAALMNVSQSRLSHRMRKLVERGYVEIHGDDADGRVSIACITT